MQNSFFPRHWPAALLLALALPFGICLPAEPPAAEGTTVTQAFPAEALAATKKFKVPPGFSVELSAAEPLLANPVSFSFDEQGRLFVVETHRRRTSVFDIRNHPEWLNDDYSFRTVLDRSNFFRKVLVPENKALPEKIKRDLNQDGQFDFRDLEVESEKIKLLEDLNGDGIYEKAAVFAGDFKSLVSGVAAGVLARGSNVWFACIPDLWLLRDQDRDGRAEFRKSLLTGFGVHISYGGHDLHGLKLGPDGKLYFTIADRGLHVEVPKGAVAYPDSGAVLRCNPDGTDFEIYAYGLRNPQELAFDAHGNLWTVDNNGDSGDPARLVQVIEGSDSGWHYGWQHLPKLGPWNTEQLWQTNGANHAFYILPPVAHLGHGPAGLAYNPGTGLPPKYDNYFFLADFPGGVRAFTVQEKGAGFVLSDLHDFLWGLFPVDVDFGYYGGLYVADWIEGWEKTGKGRIFRVYDPMLPPEAVAQRIRLLSSDFNLFHVRDLGRLLAHPDQRVRQEAQFTLASYGPISTNTLIPIAAKQENSIGRLHAIWALGQILRAAEDSIALDFVGGFLTNLAHDPHPEIRAQALKTIGDARFNPAFDSILAGMEDAFPRVRFFAAMALAKLHRPDAAEELFAFIEKNAAADPVLRHAGVMALTAMRDMNVLGEAAKDSRFEVRLAACLAMRQLEKPEIALFLYDADPRLQLEAARAINDAPITNALSQLANRLQDYPKIAASSPATNAPVTLATTSYVASVPRGDAPDNLMNLITFNLLRRILNANFRGGKLENAMALVEFAKNNQAAPALRAEAVRMLGQWGAPPARDLITGLWAPLPKREGRSASLPLRSELDALLDGQNPPELRLAAVQAVAALEILGAAQPLVQMAARTNDLAQLRVESLRALAALKDRALTSLLPRLLDDPEPAVRQEAISLQAKLNPAAALARAQAILEHGTIPEKQAALRSLADSRDSAADQLLLRSLAQFKQGQFPPELGLDLLETASRRADPKIQQEISALANAEISTNNLSRLEHLAHGGDPRAGRKIFFEKTEAACLRCHRIKDEGGVVGPKLDAIGQTRTRRQLLESVLFPSAEIAPGFENILVRLKNGLNHAGIVKSETDAELILNSPEDGEIKIPKDQIAAREHGLSAMPPDLHNILTKREIRDLIEFLASLGD